MMSIPEKDENEIEKKESWISDSELEDEHIDELREEQGIQGIPEVDVPPEYESEDDELNLQDNVNMHNSFDQSGSLNIYNRSDTRQNRNLVTGSASSERPLSDDFEEEERRVQKELESSGEMENNFISSVQNRQENVLNEYDNMIKNQSIEDEEEYDSDYPEGVEYPKDPPPAYTSPRKSFDANNQIQQQNDNNDDYYDSEIEEDSIHDDNYFENETKPELGIGALAAGGLALASGISKMQKNTEHNIDPDYDDIDEHSSQESYHYNDAITDTNNVQQQHLPPMKFEAESKQLINEKSDEISKKPVYALTNDLKNLLQIVEQYSAINVEIEPYLVPFDVNYVPAIGDVHPGITIPRPDNINDYLGFVVLDEPAAIQSSSTVMNMLLQGNSGNIKADEPVKKITRPDKNAQAIEKWIENIKEVRRTKPPERLNYTKPMPDIEKLMQEWNPDVDHILRQSKLPTANLDVTIEEFTDLCLAYADIPNHGSRIQSLHLLFSLYNEFKNSQHFRNAAYGGHNHHHTETDRLEL